MFIIVTKRRRQAHTFIPPACSGQVYSLGRRILLSQVACGKQVATIADAR